MRASASSRAWGRPPAGIWSAVTTFQPGSPCRMAIVAGETFSAMTIFKAYSGCGERSPSSVAGWLGSRLCQWVGFVDRFERMAKIEEIHEVSGCALQARLHGSHGIRRKLAEVAVLQQGSVHVVDVLDVETGLCVDDGLLCVDTIDVLHLIKGHQGGDVAGTGGVPGGGDEIAPVPLRPCGRVLLR